MENQVELKLDDIQNKKPHLNREFKVGHHQDLADEIGLDEFDIALERVFKESDQFKVRNLDRDHIPEHVRNELNLPKDMSNYDINY